MRIRRPRPRNFGFAMFAVRLFGALFLVLSTYNASGYSLVHWIGERWSQDWLVQLPILCLYVVVYMLLIRVTTRQLRAPGIALTVALLGSLAYLLVDAGVVPLRDMSDLLPIVLYMYGGLIAIGMCWASAWVMLTGQVSVDNLNA
ncbi:DUF6524 family protein [Ancylobacter sp. TS-1]|uniref:DUF6524 family protein n=1 Tax=Ancylobacter sp. TS-1 TaxID=1850374 RepID=UPI001265BE90|nr:DUF6524 family protein [Ancylobacter sp. TS-1]QFR32694.1 hypothetical protein GBB76_05890 [Ancylobacter sp. TS-1]